MLHLGYEKVRNYSSGFGEKIHEGRYPENELLPSENQLTVLYQTSRATVRQALKILEENGIIQRRHGFGSIVIPRERLMFPISGLTSFKELKDSLNFSSTTEILIFEKITVDKDLSELSFLKKALKLFISSADEILMSSSLS